MPQPYSKRLAALCLYLKMGLDRKEIAQMLNINTESVRKHIYRLKLKLGQNEKYPDFVATDVDDFAFLSEL